MTTHFNKTSDCIEELINSAGKNLIIGTPLGIGKPNPLINEIWQKAKTDSSIKLEICTALSLQVPVGKSLFEKRFLKPFTDRLFGENYPQLEYIDDVANDKVPKNMKVTEFYMQSGKMLKSATAQKSYTSSNYTHAARDMLNNGLNVLMQMVSVKEIDGRKVYSLSSNTDLTTDLINIAKRKKIKKPIIIGMVNPNLPFMGAKAQVEEDFFDILVDDHTQYFLPFATPKAAINNTDYNIGLLASSLIKDGGTMQVGIGSLGDALIYAMKLRQNQNSEYKKILQKLHIFDKCDEVIKKSGSTSTFDKGVYAASEMFVEGFAHLFDEGILKRKVYPDAQIQSLLNQEIITEKIQENIIEILLQHEVLDEFITKKQMQRLQNLGILKADLQMQKGYMIDSKGKKYKTDLFEYKNIKAIQENCLGDKLKQGVLLHGAFFLGSRWFYRWLHELNENHRELFQMTPVSQVNELYGGEELDRVQRIKARFINTCMKVDLLGAAASDTLDNNQVVSGVGGQYNFVAMAQTLEDSRSVLMVRSTHVGAKGLESNIVWKYPYCTIPRHLRDIVITEYGIADLRGQSDEECVKRMICIADSQFQEELCQTAMRFNKLSADWEIPQKFRNNTAQELDKQINHFKHSGLFPTFPFGCDFTDEELVIVKALKYLKSQTGSTFSKIKLLFKSLLHKSQQDNSKYLQRMNLQAPRNREEKISRKLLIFALNQTQSP